METEKEIYRYIRRHRDKQDSWSTREIGDAFDLNAYMARYYLTVLCRKGLLCRSVMQRGAPVLWSLPARQSR
ncbi:FaeA/PapI family transcriptional regulator [Citrobacter braakii]